MCLTYDELLIELDQVHAISIKRALYIQEQKCELDELKEELEYIKTRYDP